MSAGEVAGIVLGGASAAFVAGREVLAWWQKKRLADAEASRAAAEAEKHLAAAEQEKEATGRFRAQADLVEAETEKLTQQQLFSFIGGLKVRVDGQAKEIETQRTRLDEKGRAIEALQLGLEDCERHRQDQAEELQTLRQELASVQTDRDRLRVELREFASRLSQF